MPAAQAEGVGAGALHFARHPRGGLRHLGGALGLFCLGALFVLSWPRGPHVVHLGASIAMGAAVAWAAWWVAHWRRRRLVLGERTLRIGAGLVGRRSRVIPLGEIEGATVEQALLERLVGTGDVELLLTGSRRLTVRDVRRPGRLVTELEAACRRFEAPARAPLPSPRADGDNLAHLQELGVITAHERAELEERRPPG